MSFATRLKERRESLGISRTELAQTLGVTPSAVGNYENGISSPKEEILYKIFSALDVEPNYLWQDEMSGNSIRFLVSYPEQEHIQKYRALDEHGKHMVNIVLEAETERMKIFTDSSTNSSKKTIRLSHSELKTSAGTGWELEDEEMEQWKVLWNDLTRKADFCVDVAGNSMEPMFSDGDVLLIRSQPAVNIGEIGLYIFDGSGYVKRQEDGYIHSLNPKYPDVFPTEESPIECKGLVLGVLKPEWIIER